MLQNVRQQESPSSACGALPWIQTHCQILCVGRCLQFVLQVLPHTQGKRLIEHLKDVPTCLQVYQHSLPALPDDMVQALEDHAHTRTHTHTLRMQEEGWWATKALQPVHKIQGPSLPPAGTQDAQQMLAKWTTRMQPAGSAY